MNYTSKQVYEYISKQTGDPIVEWKTCRVSGQEFAIYQSDLDFYERISPVFNGKKYLIPTPTLCPEERQRRRLVWRNESKLYRRKCDATGKSIISVYHPDLPYTVYSNDAWFSDQWSGLEYGIDRNKDTTIFEHIDRLLRAVPHLARYSLHTENAEYTNGVSDIKNCYLCFNCDYLEDCMYVHSTNHSSDCVDCYMTFYAEQCFECINIVKSTRLFYSQNCEECHNCWYMFDSVGISDCFGCTHLVQKKYCIFNNQYDKESYEQEKAKILSTMSHDEILQKVASLRKEKLHRSLNTLQCEESYGNYLTNVSSSVFCYSSNNIERCKYGWYLHTCQDCMDYDIYGDSSQWIYESIMTGTNGYNLSFCLGNWNGSKNNLYSLLLVSCTNCFGCVGLKNKEYCIFNRQYSKEEYEQIVPQLIMQLHKEGQRGEFFGPSLCPFGYNESMANDYYQMSDAEAKSSGYSWQYDERPVNLPSQVQTIEGGSLPRTEDADASICQKVILCAATGKPYRIIQQEFDFYKKWKLPLPSFHPDVRHKQRLAKDSTMELHIVDDAVTGKKILSQYSSETPNVCDEQVYKQHYFS